MAPRRPVPAPFGEEPTRQVDDELLTALRASEQQAPSPRQKAPTFLPATAPPPKVQFDEPTRLVADLDPREFDDVDHRTELDDGRHRFLAQSPTTEPDAVDQAFENAFDIDEATRMSSVESIAAMEQARKQPVAQGPAEERTRAVNIRGDKSISDIDWDLD